MNSLGVFEHPRIQLRLRSRLEAPPPSGTDSTEVIVRLAGTRANSSSQDGPWNVILPLT